MSALLVPPGDSTEDAEPARTRNPRGQGLRLREDIVRGAAQILEESGSPDAVTLRAVARAVGIAAPSIYLHFPDRESILTALVSEAFLDLVGRLDVVTRDDGPERRLRTMCGAYVQFAREQPRRYAVLFSSVLPRPPDGAPGPGMAAFQVLVDALQDCVDAGVSDSDDVFADATDLWVALHGLVTLLSGARFFPWPDTAEQLDRLVGRLARLRRAHRGVRPV